MEAEQQAEEPHAIGVDAGISGGPPVAADRRHHVAERRPPEDDREDHGDHDQDRAVCVLTAAASRPEAVRRSATP